MLMKEIKDGMNRQKKIFFYVEPFITARKTQVESSKIRYAHRENNTKH